MNSDIIHDAAGNGKPRARLGHVLTHRLPRRVEQLLVEHHWLRWRLEGYSLGQLPLQHPDDVDRELARDLLRRDCTPEECASAIYLRHAGTCTRQDDLERAIDIASSAAWTERHAA